MAFIGRCAGHYQRVLRMSTFCAWPKTERFPHVRKSFLLLPLILLVGACRTGAKSAHSFRAPVGDTSAVVAGIDTTGITKAEVEKLLSPMVVQIAQQAQQSGQTFDDVAQPLRRQATAQLLVQAVVEAEAAKLHLVPDAHKVDSIYKAVTAQFPDTAALMAALAQSGDTPESVHKKIASQVVANELMEKAMADSLKIPEARIDSFYQANKAKFGGAGQVRGRHILLLVKNPADSAKVHKQILDIYAKLLKDDKQFSTIARAQSEDPGSKEKGGDLGWFDPKDMVPEFAAAARTLEPGKISAPIRTQYGWHILQIQDRKTGKVPPLDSVRVQIENMLNSQVAERQVPAYYRRLLKAHNVVFLDKTYEEPTLMEEPKPAAASTISNEIKPEAPPANEMPKQ
jgi:parvulin-like peptidyl-prolyl isomerase